MHKNTPSNKPAGLRPYKSCLLYTSKTLKNQGKSPFRGFEYGLKAARRAPQFSKR